jgi:ketosteroid isomerase-like protein
MQKIMQAVILSTLMGTLPGTGAAYAADTKVVDHHVAAIKAGNLEGVLSDYAADAVVVTPAGMITPSGVFVGADTRKLFSVLTDKDHLPGVKSMQTRYVSAGPDTTIMHWVQFKGTPKEVDGHDVFVVRGGKIVFQSVTVDDTKK